MKYGERLTSDRSMLPAGRMCWVWVKMQARSPMQQSTENLIVYIVSVMWKAAAPIGKRDS